MAFSLPEPAMVPTRRNDRRARNHASYWAFVVHRISGVLLALFLPLHFWALGQSLAGAAALDEFLRWADQPLFKFAEWGLVVLLSAHLTGGTVEMKLNDDATDGVTRRALAVWLTRRGELTPIQATGGWLE